MVIPVYGCDTCLRALHGRLRATLDKMTQSSEIIFVDDRSPDGAWETLRSLAAEDPGVKAIRMSRNFGQHYAITAGIAESRGRWIAVMDCDLQDEPEHLVELHAKALEGHDIVLARRTRRRTSWPRRVAGHTYYRLRNRLVGADMFANYTNLSLISRKVAEAFLALRDRDRQYLLILHWLGFNRAEIEVDPAERHSGRSAYNWRALVRVAVDGMFFQSTVLLRWIVYAGFLFAAAGAALAEVTKVNDGMTTSSPGPTPASSIDISSADVPDAVRNARRQPMRCSSHSPQRRSNGPLPDRWPASIACWM